MTLKLHNTLTGQKDDFIPLDPNRITLYVCGPTVYNFCLLYTSPSPRDLSTSRMPSSA